jgi:hypothetical protein
MAGRKKAIPTHLLIMVWPSWLFFEMKIDAEGIEVDSAIFLTADHASFFKVKQVFCKLLLFDI